MSNKIRDRDIRVFQSRRFRRKRRLWKTQILILNL